MNGILTITLNGKPERVRFNQYANAELAKHLIPQNLQSDIPHVEVMRAVVEKAQDNLPALIKLVVYAGILGDSLVYGSEPRLTMEQVGEYIGEASDEEILRIWGAFLQVQSKDEKEAEKKK